MTNKLAVVPRTSYKEAVQHCNNALLDLKAQLKALNHVYDFSSSLSNLTHTDASNALVCDRIVKKMYDPNISTSGLRDAAFSAYLAYEQTTLKSVNDSFTLWEPTFIGFHIRKARDLLHRWFSGFKIDLSFNPEDLPDIQFTPGESFIPNKGNTNILAKLSTRDHWTTTDACLEDTLQLIYNCTSLKRAAKELIGHVSRRERTELYANAIAMGYVNNPGYYVFSILLQERVLTVVGGARASSVPKNVEKDRFINIEATFPMILQRIVASRIKKVLKSVGNFIAPLRSYDAQKLHGMMISFAKYATVDFSNASDSVLLKVVNSLFPQEFCRYVNKYRSMNVFFNGEPYSPIKLSSMGNGFTFETMTALLYAIAMTFDWSNHPPRVFGDDVIIHNSHAQKFIDVCSYIGFSANMKKTFINSRFRESCGKFFHDDFGYILSYDVHPCKSFQDCIINHNKLYAIVNYGSCDYIVNSLIQTCIDRIRAVAKAWHIGPVPISESLRSKYLSLYFWDRKAWRKQSRSATCKTLFRGVVGKSGSYFADMQIPVDDKTKLPIGSCICLIPFFVPKLSKFKRTRAAKFASILYSGSRVKDTIAGKGKWIDLQAIVDQNGNVTLTRNIFKYAKGIQHVPSLGDLMSLEHHGFQVEPLNNL